jgi:hypothetical protein
MHGSGQWREAALRTFMRTAGAAERVARYRQEAEKFRRIAQSETDNGVRQSFLDLAKEYEV